ncbi:MAG TPA: adenylate/guanylate cyclase domain-containing protein [Alphaproteobacteria bacterium]|nr:adenylate/guanylate cyclase domain-containing protein [Alphaproteobacteria bacterium]
MQQGRAERRLAAILAADVVGYSRLMGVDEEGTLRQLKLLRKELVDPKIIEHRGRIVKTTGDGVLVEFASVVDAVRCAVDVQRGMAERNAAMPQEKRIEFRIGINLGDIIIDGDDIFGDGVNIAARLEALAEPGGICVNRVVRDQVRDKLDIAFEDLGEQQVKNIARPVHVYRIQPEHWSSKLTAAGAVSEASKPVLVLPDKPSIAVLPFQDMSGDADQEYFADGVVEEIITALSRMRWLFVIARNSSFTYKGHAVDVKQVGRELGVRYVVEGSVRKAANRVRITGQLIDASTGAHLWADRFDGGLEDIFDLQDQVTASVVGAIATKLEQAEIERAKRKPTESLDAYDYYLRGMASAHQWTEEGVSEALRLFYKAIELDPDFAEAYGMAAWCYVPRKANWWMGDPVQEIAEAERLARRAVDLGADNAVALAGGGYALAFVVHDLDSGAAFIDQALALNPNLALAWHCSGWVKAFLGEPEAAIKQLTHTMRLSPLDPLGFRAQGGIAFAHFLAGRYDEASLWAERALRQRPTFLPAIRDLAAADALAGRLFEAQKTMAHLRQLAPSLRVTNVKDWVPFRRPEDLARLEDGLRKAGLPE